MLLVVDAGNTEIVFGLYEEENLSAHLRLSSKPDRTSDEYWILLKTWCENRGFSLSNVEGVVISSVVPSLTTVFEKISSNYIKMKPLVITAETDTGLKILYETPQTVGADRICNAVAGHILYGTPLIVVDFGTATTFDVISEKGEYLGGVITLGLRGITQELHRLTAKLPKVDLVFPHTVVGRTTETSIQSGIMWGSVVVVDGMVNRIIKEMKWEKAHVVSTGGMASTVVEKSDRIQAVEPFLTLEGMRFIFQRIRHNRT